MKTHITVILDSSGSMSKIEEDTKGGFNSFLEDQKNEPGEATVTLYEFNTGVSLVYEMYPIEEAPELTDANYSPGGNTALHDAMYRGLNETAEKGDSQSEKPDNVIVLVLTDGKENASETPPERVKEQVKYRREEHGWEFLFIGANQDAALTAKEVGVQEDRSLNMAHSGEGVQSAYESSSERVREARREGAMDDFTEEDRMKQEEAKES